MVIYKDNVLATGSLSDSEGGHLQDSPAPASRCSLELVVHMASRFALASVHIFAGIWVTRSTSVEML